MYVPPVAQVYRSVKRHSTEWQYTSESVNFGIDSLNVLGLLLLSVCCVRGIWYSGNRWEFILPHPSLLYPFGALFTKFFGSIQKLFLILKGNSLASDSCDSRQSFSFPVHTFPCWCCSNAHPVDQLPCHAPMAMGDVPPSVRVLCRPSIPPPFTSAWRRQLTVSEETGNFSLDASNWHIYFPLFLKGTLCYMSNPCVLLTFEDYRSRVIFHRDVTDVHRWEWKKNTSHAHPFEGNTWKPSAGIGME